MHPSASAYDPLIRHQCVSVPVHPPSQLALARQIQLVCLFTFVRDEAIRAGQAALAVDQFRAFGSYLVRILGDGSRFVVSPSPSLCMLKNKIKS